MYENRKFGDNIADCAASSEGWADALDYVTANQQHKPSVIAGKLLHRSRAPNFPLSLQTYMSQYIPHDCSA